ncbi:Alpha/Beta hydrolase protein [Boletus edulis BED1]|uniref:Alpha/Beta hydrolase protein n=1 Tax=Boletus edulis BED1 TaxID=1328754 RepID=A0AAD4G8B7_BOLED|nr:Alpha/Beta hydrolase protein [Boletus edulis BED1]
MVRILRFFTVGWLLSHSAIVLALAVFNPGEYDTNAVRCPAIDRVLDQTLNITIEYVDINPLAKTTILMVHGWPSLWSSWARQNDYRLLAIDVRGFGGSTHPSDIQSSSTMADIAGDLTCVLEHAGVSSAICMGHDWGSVACYEAARRRPDVFSAVIGVTIPYLPSAGDFEPIESMSGVIPTLSYQVFFARNTSVAVVELNTDVRRTLRGTLRSVASPPPKSFLRSSTTFMGAWDVPIPPIPFFSQEEEDYFVERFSRQGFDHSLMFYTSGNKYGTWKSAHDQGNFTIPQPVLSVLPLKDPVADWNKLAESSKVAMYLPQLTTKTMDGAHWPHMEFPDEFNAITEEWIERVGLKGGISEKVGGPQLEGERGKHVVSDEL